MSLFNNTSNQFVLVILLVLTLSPVAHSNVLVNPRNTNLNFYLGNFSAAEEPGVLEDASSHVAFGLASSSQSRQHPYLAVDVELWLLYSEFRNTLPAPLFVSVSDDMELETTALTIGARFMYPYDTPYRFYISGGYGYFLSRMRVYASMLGVPGYYEDDTTEFAPYLGAGLSINLGYRQTIEFFYRKWDTQGDFSRFEIPETDLGGEAIGIGFGMYW